jgi:hypothetical protein
MSIQVGVALVDGQFDRGCFFFNHASGPAASDGAASTGGRSVSRSSNRRFNNRRRFRRRLLGHAGESVVKA